MSNEEIESPATSPRNRRTLVRDVAVFQVKVIVDGFRDLLLVPASLVAGIISLLAPGRPGTEFYDLLKLGRRSERWINLFGAAEKLHGPPTADEAFGGTDIDRFADRVEEFVVDEYRQGELTRQARERLDRAIERLRESKRR